MLFDRGYAYGFQGQERDDEIKGKGNSYSYKYRMDDPRVGRFLSIDPKAGEYPFYSPYDFSGDRVIDMIELEGAETKWYRDAIEEGGLQLEPIHASNIRDKVNDLMQNYANKYRFSQMPIAKVYNINPGNYATSVELSVLPASNMRSASTYTINGNRVYDTGRNHTVSIARINARVIYWGGHRNGRDLPKNVLAASIDGGKVFPQYRDVPVAQRFSLTVQNGNNIQLIYKFGKGFSRMNGNRTSGFTTQNFSRVYTPNKSYGLSGDKSYENTSLNHYKSAQAGNIVEFKYKNGVHRFYQYNGKKWSSAAEVDVHNGRGKPKTKPN